ncbi:MAG TPA: PsbP-related protein [Bacteroidota bacterium]|nr:PsbP-related protein [Bacteroidota bacterium]
MKSLLVSLLFVGLFMSGCEQKKLEPIAVGEMNEYKDPGYGFKIKYPKEWRSIGTTGKAVFCKSQEVANKFIDPSTGEEGAEVVAEVQKYGGSTPEATLQAAKDELKQTWQDIELKPDEQVTVAGKTATKVPYSVKVTSKTSIIGFRVFVPGDTALYSIDCVGYGDQYAIHTAVFDAVLKSFELPFVAPRKSNVWVASTNMDTYQCEYFTMPYPDNLVTAPQQKKDKDLVMELHADRLDCSIHIDVFGAKKLTVDKVWEQNKGKYKAKGTGESTIDGNKAYWVDYPSGVPNISSRAYFVVKNDKVIRITINYFAPQREAYFNAFEKCVSSLKLK